MKMLVPPHPGGLVKHECIEASGLTVTAAAMGLRVSRGALSELINERAGISPEMALRFEAVGWGKAEGWLGMQLDHDLWRAKQTFGKSVKLKPFKVPSRPDAPLRATRT